MQMLHQHDPQTFLHSSRVAELSLQIGEQLDLTNKELRNLVISAFLHDIGKTLIPASVLNSPKPLTASQWEDMKMHPIWGAEMYDGNPKIKEGIISHHENYDGTGYPYGLRGEKIPYTGRIIAIADSLDAMTAVRAYKTQINVDAAIREIRDCAETKYDPYIIRAIYKKNIFNILKPFMVKPERRNSFCIKSDLILGMGIPK
jgi:HD-GYP domain-containing protein (c-di-GMP phosphodiesterase class II)